MMMDDVQWTLIHLFRADCPEDSVLPMHWRQSWNSWVAKEKKRSPSALQCVFAGRLEEGKLWNFTKATGVSSCQPGFPLSTSTSVFLEVTLVSPLTFKYMKTIKTLERALYLSLQTVQQEPNQASEAGPGASLWAGLYLPNDCSGIWRSGPFSQPKLPPAKSLDHFTLDKLPADTLSTWDNLPEINSIECCSLFQRWEEDRRWMTERIEKTRGDRRQKSAQSDARVKS